MEKIIIGISGRAATGKDFLADAILDHIRIKEWPLTSGKFSFADPLKEYAAMMTGQCKCNFYTQEGKQMMNKFGMTNREFLQKLGVKMREIHEDFWVIKAFDRVKLEDKEISIIPDMRFPNELKAVKDRGGITIRTSLLATSEKWKELMGIKSLVASPNGLISKENMIDFIKGYDFMLEENELEILTAMEHISETALDDAEFDIQITSKYGEGVDIDRIAEYIRARRV